MLSSSRATSAQDIALSTRGPIRAFLQNIRSNHERIEDVETTLLEALLSLKLVPTGFNFQGTPSITFNEVLSAISTIQHSILTYILPVWFRPLKESRRLTLIKQFFCPSNDILAKPESAIGVEIAINGLSNTLSYISTLDVNGLGPRELLDFCLTILQEITSLYSLDVVFENIFLSNHALPKDDGVLQQIWEDHVRNAVSLPGKVMNIHDPKVVQLSQELEYRSYFSSLCVASERIIFKASQGSLKDAVTQAMAHLLLKLINQGLFPSVRPGLTVQPSFLASTLPTIQHRIQLKESYAKSSDMAPSSYTEAWRAAVRGLPLLSQQVLIRSLFASLDVEVGIDVSSRSLKQVKDGVSILHAILGRSTSDDEPSKADSTMKMILAVLLNPGKSWDIGLARTITCWVADPKASIVNEEALSDFLNEVMDIWTNPDHIRHSLYSRQRFVTSLLLMTIAALPRSSSTLQRLSFSSPFISSITTFLSHTDLSIRQFGMLVAEVVAERCQQKLNFGGWDGTGEHLELIRTLRGWVNDWTREAFYTSEPMEDTSVVSKVDKEDLPHPKTMVVPEVTTDSDDESLSGYSSSHGSSRPPSPTPSELEEMEKDPTLRVGRSRPIPKPVYLAQLVTLLRKSSTDEKDTAEIIEVILNSAELLIRRKKGFGYELEENAVQLTISLIMLRNNYEIEGFDEKRQAALIALVECCPKQTAQTLIEQFFTNQYSTSDRLTMLTALALGARTLAGLANSATPESLNLKAAFPSKLLPPALHRRYATHDEDQQTQVQKVLGGITRLALNKSKDEAEDALIAAGNKEIPRTRMLRLGSTAKGGRIEVLETTTSSALAKPQSLRPSESFTILAAEYFIMPLINHMWLYLRDTDTRVRKDVAGTGIILDTVVLAQFLNTLTVLVHAARNSPAFLGIIAPACMEIAVTLGTRPIEVQRNMQSTATTTSLPTTTPAMVLTAAMELALFSLDASVSLDDGQTLALENTALLMALSTWAGEILNVLDKGYFMLKSGGDMEGKLNAVVAGVVIKIEKITEKWGRVM